MSYRDDLRAFRQARDVRKKQIFLLMKITVVLLALVIVATTVLVIAEIASGDSNSFIFKFNLPFKIIVSFNSALSVINDEILPNNFLSANIKLFKSKFLLFL